MFPLRYAGRCLELETEKPPPGNPIDEIPGQSDGLRFRFIRAITYATATPHGSSMSEPIISAFAHDVCNELVQTIALGFRDGDRGSLIGTGIELLMHAGAHDR